MHSFFEWLPRESRPTHAKLDSSEAADDDEAPTNERRRGTWRKCVPCLSAQKDWPCLSWILIRVRARTPAAILNFRRKSPDGDPAANMSQTSVSNSANPARDKYVVLHGYLKKLKTGRRRYFVLFRDGPDQSARLDYFETEKKFKSRFSQPKRSIVLKSCFHINRRLDTKHRFVVALYTKDDCFCLVMDSDVKMTQWLKAMTDLHRDETEGDKSRTTFGECTICLFCYELFFICINYLHFNIRNINHWPYTFFLFDAPKYECFNSMQSRRA